MKRFGDNTEAPVTEMDQSHLFRMGLYLLMIMIKARLEGYPVGEFRKAAVIETASQVHKSVSRIDAQIAGIPSHSQGTSAFHLFRERVKLLCVMATAMVSEEYPLGRHRRDAVLDNIESIGSFLFPGQDLSIYRNILKAA
ncbi:MAG: hypothetical protein HUN04_02975 [Desulfobacter sp.]|nr:MAG: hypothetical protein HUN04_02975 [Desulfobacter sp.]